MPYVCRGGVGGNVPCIPLPPDPPLSSRAVELPSAAEILPTVALKKREGTQFENRCQMCEQPGIRAAKGAIECPAHFR